VYHVLNHAVAKVDLFRSDADHVGFQKTLQDSIARLPMELFSYCVMTNHWHLVVRPTNDGDLSTFMHWLTLTHAQRWRASHNTVGYGPLYRGRFKAFAIEEDNHLLTVLRYVERNALRAKMVKKAQDWLWGSLHARLHGTAEERAILTEWPITEPTDWVKFVNMPQTAAEEAALKQSIHKSRPFGKPDWQMKTAKKLGLQSCFHTSGRPKKTDKR
jgi:putative transposase